MVTNDGLYLAIGAPMLFSTTLIGLLMAVNNAKFTLSEKVSTHGSGTWKSARPSALSLPHEW